ncbi:MAG: polysaccharide deacetylase family protein [Oscillospiraceae bacterium]|nr:polysaccharide deacetylase family protein [Oscillospiraceae bacterium]
MSKFILGKKFELAVIFLAFLTAAALAVTVKTSQAVSAETVSRSVPTLFYNDTDYHLADIMPLYETDGVLYIPRYFVSQIYTIEMSTRDNYREDFFIQYKDRWIAFKVSADIAVTSLGEEISCKVHFFRGVTYVPAILVAEKLGLGWEYNEEYNSFRLKELGTRRTFEELLARFIRTPATTPPPETPPPVQITTNPPVEITTNPGENTRPATEPYADATQPHSEPAGGEPPDNTPEQPQHITEPPVRPQPVTTAEPTTAENTREIENYLMFYNGGGEVRGAESETDELLRILGGNNISATFFMSGNEISENPDIVRKIYASGHGLGINLNLDSGVSDSDLITELESVNDLIYSLVKHKTRFYIYEGGYLDNSGEEELVKKGYYFCGRSADTQNFRDEDIINSSEMTEFLKLRRINIIAFDTSEDYYGDYLDFAISASRTKFYINFSQINNADIENIRRRTNR